VVGTTKDTASGLHPVVYAGRFADRVSSAKLPEDCEILSEWDVLPFRLVSALQRATTLVVLDLFSFPFESMTEEQRDVPLVVVLPLEFDAQFLNAVFGEAVLGRLGFFDRVVTGDRDLWEELRRRYRWAGSQRIELHSLRPEEAAAEICARLEEEAATLILSGEDYEALRYCRERGDALAASVPQRAIRIAPFDLPLDKAVHRVQAEALGPQFAAARGVRAEDVPFDVLEVGTGVGRWATKFDPATTSFVGLDVNEAMIHAARANFSEERFDLLEGDLVFPYADESFDLAFTVSVLHHNSMSSKRTLVSEMWRVTRPGGRLMFLEDFVSEKRTLGSTIHPTSLGTFVDLVLEATSGRVALEHFEALRYPHDPFFRGGLLSLSKVGTPQAW
jgi:SAM-dependent methyltransferase